MTDYFDLSTADCPRVHKDELYKSMLKCDPNSDMCYKNATNHLSPRLIKISKQVAEIILENEYESHKKIAKVIADAVIDARNTFYGL